MTDSPVVAALKEFDDWYQRGPDGRTLEEALNDIGALVKAAIPLAEAMEAEVARLRGALRAIVEANVSHSHHDPCGVEGCEGYCDSDYHDWHTHIGGGHIARAALEGSEG